MKGALNKRKNLRNSVDSRRNTNVPSQSDLNDFQKGAGDSTKEDENSHRAGVLARLEQRRILLEVLGSIVAIGLLLATWYQGLLTRRALNETRNEFSTSQRAYMILGGEDGTLAKFRSVEGRDAPLLVVHFFNAGGSIARNFHANLYTGWKPLPADRSVGPSGLATPSAALGTPPHGTDLRFHLLRHCRREASRSPRV